MLVMLIKDIILTVVRRYEFYVWVAKQYLTSEIVFAMRPSSRQRVMFFLLYYTDQNYRSELKAQISKKSYNHGIS